MAPPVIYCCHVAFLILGVHVCCFSVHSFDVCLVVSLFPYGRFYRWLSYGNVDKDEFMNREFSFTLKDDVYIRYQSFRDQAEMQAAIVKRNPYKIDIGAVFTHKVSASCPSSSHRRRQPAHAPEKSPRITRRSLLRGSNP